MVVYLSEVSCVIYLFIHCLLVSTSFILKKHLRWIHLVVKAFKLLNKTQKILSGT